MWEVNEVKSKEMNLINSQTHAKHTYDTKKLDFIINSWRAGTMSNHERKTTKFRLYKKKSTPKSITRSTTPLQVWEKFKMAKLKILTQQRH